MRTEDKCEYNKNLGLILIAVALLVISGFYMAHDTNELSTRVEELETEIAELKQTADAYSSACTDELICLDNRLQELSSRVDEIVTLSYDYDYIVRVVAAESRGEPIEGQKAVAQTILERSKEWGMTPEQVVKADGQYADPININDVPNTTWEACCDVFLRGERIFEKPVKWFNNPSVGRSATHESKTLAGVIGNHAFYY